MGMAEPVNRWAAGDEGKSFVAPAKGDNAKGNDGGDHQQQVKGDFGGDPKASAAATAAKFPELCSVHTSQSWWRAFAKRSSPRDAARNTTLSPPTRIT
ncbi:hypothetical protein [Sinorhizobium meliloti]|uniref:hypothetical protein n=1 Tax=Rhizobium meliloti TaxID=382 RepID=UPI001296CD86|nr:hypothetical protein [Sinorhizobium meliloti]MQW58121.1 hypothetical protein [Sinorhizobium meliloti]